MLRITFLGTGGSTPTPNRNPSAIAVNREGELMLFDCGEGTQRQMMRAKTGMAVSSIFITHFHADHVLGIPGLLQTMALQGRKEPLEIFGPRYIDKFLYHLLSLGYVGKGFEVKAIELKPGDEVRRQKYRIKAIKTVHNVESIGYVLEEDVRPGRFNRERAIELGIKPGPLFSRLQSGHTITVDGREIRPEQVLGPPRPGRKIVYTGDTRPCESVVEASRGADLLIHDSSMSEEVKQYAIEYMHSTALEAAEVAKEAGVRKLILTHISARYSDLGSAMRLEEEAKRVFENVEVAKELMTVEVRYRDS
ncbi:MAG: ribonuclease Z [Methanophagales archaeon]|nr:ribonuclease Z [Methanophagales archaeon]MCW3139745.1 ribonuclease Z [Methanophagales archaeon]MCW7069249.1 ribonuclease Z [Methanophagales archaeon]MCW7073785.1 ribonuclease Z [Methanophagales archaeon]